MTNQREYELPRVPLHSRGKGIVVETQGVGAADHSEGARETTGKRREGEEGRKLLSSKTL